MAIAPAEPSVSSSSINMGQSVTITHSSPSLIGIKRYTITWSFAGQSGTLATQTADTSTVWTPALATFAAYIPNAVSGVATITCATYDLSESSSTPVGTKSCAVTLLVPSSVKPTLSSVSVSEGNTSLPSAFSGNYVKGYSKLKLSFTASGANGSTIKSASYTCDGKTYTGTFSAATVNGSITSDTLTQVGTGKSVSVTVTDSRGRTASQTIGSLTFKDYSVPQITSFKARRSSGNTASATGTNAQRYIAASVTSVGTNSITSAVLSWKQKTASVWATSDKVTIASSGTAIPSSGTAAWTVIAKSGSNVTFDGLYAYDFKLEVTDKAGNTTTSYTYISTVSVMLDFNDAGNGIGIGMINQSANTIDSAWALNAPYLNIAHNTWPTLAFGASTGDLTASVFYAIESHRLGMAQKAVGSSYRESYLLPTPSVVSEDKWYSILTTKPGELVPIANGGTGASNAYNALANLGGLHTSGGTMSGGQTWTQIGFASTDSDYTAIGAVFGSHSANYTRMGFTEWYKGSTYSEDYLLPTPTSHSDERKWYNILTSRDAVTVAQGGTGATDAATARSNLGLGTMATQSASAYLPLTGGTLTGNLSVGSASWHGISLRAGNDKSRIGFLHTGNSLTIDLYAANSTGGDRYLLPTPASQSTDAWYNIVTTKFFKRGTVAMRTYYAGTASTATTISFGQTYSTPPTVVATLTGAHTEKVVLTISNITTTGFDYGISNSSSINVSVGMTWMAFGG